MLLPDAYAADCFGESKIPKILAGKNFENNSRYYTITGNNDAIFVGGQTEEEDLTQETYFGSVITRIDLATLTVVWMMFYGNGSDYAQVDGLALSPDDTKLAVCASKRQTNN